ncbi:MAG: anti-anti-sigma factor [Motiliproteus sp.]|jgi:anti-anti-sigma factor
MLNGKILFAEQAGTYVLKFVGDVRLTLCATLDQFLATTLEYDNFKSIIIDLTETQGIDSTSLGLLAKLSVRLKRRHRQRPTIVSTNEDITRVLLSMGFDKVFILIQDRVESSAELRELDLLQESEERVRERVLDAHRALMDLNANNREAFRDLVRSLENEL